MGRIKYLEALGREVKRGRPPLGPPPSKADLVKLYVTEDRSARDVAAILGCSKDAIYRALKQYGIKARTPVRKSRLAKTNRKSLFADITEKGVCGTSKAWGIPVRTLKRYLARVRREKIGK